MQTQHILCAVMKWLYLCSDACREMINLVLDYLPRKWFLCLEKQLPKWHCSSWWTKIKDLGYPSLWIFPQIASSPLLSMACQASLVAQIHQCTAQGQTLQRSEVWVFGRGVLWGWDPTAKYRYLDCLSLLLDISELDEGTASLSRGDVFTLKRLTVKVVVLWGSGMAWVLQSTSPALLCSVQGGTAVSSGEAPHCCHRRLSAHLMHPLASSTQGVNPCCRSLAPSLPFCFMYSYQCVSSVSSWLSEVSAMTYAGVSVLRWYYCHSPSGLNARRVSCLMEPKCWVVEGALLVCIFALCCPLCLAIFFFILELRLMDGSKSKWQERKTGTSFFNLFR